MSEEQPLQNSVRAHRLAHRWTQEELAVRAGVSRAGISAIETGRFVPSAATVLTLAAVFGCRVEDVFSLETEKAAPPTWAWQPPRNPCRYWRARVAGRELLYPVEPTNLGLVPHDGVLEQGLFANGLPRPPATPSWWHPAILPSACWPTNSAVAAAFACSPSREPAGRPSPCWRKGWYTWWACIWPQSAAAGKTPRRPRSGCTAASACCAGALAGGPGPGPRAPTPQRPCGPSVPGPLGGARSRFGCPRVAR